MINANELRIGNLVDYFGKIKTVIRVGKENSQSYIGCADKQTELMNCWNIGDAYDPIPLTEEWLIKLGFIKMPVNGYTYLLKISAATLQCRCNGDKWYFQFNDTYFGEMFPYVHQVQNFCASLGKELAGA